MLVTKYIVLVGLIRTDCILCRDMILMFFQIGSLFIQIHLDKCCLHLISHHVDCMLGSAF